MNNALPSNASAATLSQQARAAWLARTPGERQWLTVLAVLAGLALVWVVAVGPALRTLRAAPATIDSLDQQLQSFNTMASEVTELRQAPPVGPTQAGAALTAATARLGPRGRLVLQGERATLTLTGATTEDLRSWLGEARTAARARPVEMQLMRAGQGYNGSLTVALGGTL